MSRRRKPVRYDVRNVPPLVDESLRARARREGKSLNQVLIEPLSRSSPVGTGTSRGKRNLARFAGSWRPDPECDRILAEFNQIDPG